MGQDGKKPFLNEETVAVLFKSFYHDFPLSIDFSQAPFASYDPSVLIRSKDEAKQALKDLSWSSGPGLLKPRINILSHGIYPDIIMVQGSYLVRERDTGSPIEVEAGEYE